MECKRIVARRRRKWLLLTAVVFLGLLLAETLWYPYGHWNAGRSANQAENGLWLRYSWYFGRRNEADLQGLTEHLRHEQIRYAYFHVRDIQKDGTLRYRNSTSALRLTNTLHRETPTVKAIAWIYAGNTQGEGQVNLSNPHVRRAMVQQAVWLVNVCGFDGVQWDYEICPDHDAGLLALLRETRAALGPGKLLSVATPMWLPRPLAHWGWSDDYFTQVAGQCDQIVVMAYDSGCYLPRGYVWLVHQQVVHITQDAAQSHTACRVLIGVPTYGRGGLSHDSHTENIGLSLLGVRQGASDSGVALSHFAGVAIFADYTTQPSEWLTYEKMWTKGH